MKKKLLGLGAGCLFSLGVCFSVQAFAIDSSGAASCTCDHSLKPPYSTSCCHGPFPNGNKPLCAAGCAAVDGGTN